MTIRNIKEEEKDASLRYRVLLSRFMEWITGEKGSRYFPAKTWKEVDWSPCSWTHNVFRVYEMLFGRRYGIRAEITSRMDPDGIVTYQAHSFEGACALFETAVRRLFDFKLKVRIVKVWVPAFSSPVGLPMMNSPYRFAIALDTSTTQNDLGADSSTHTFSHTCTGSNLLLTIHMGSNFGQSAVATYNGSNSTQIGSELNNGNNSFQSSFYVANPATGAHNIVTKSNSGRVASTGISYSGVDTSSPIDSSNTASSASATVGNYSVSTTVVASNCWLVACAASQPNSGTPNSLASNRTDRGNMVNNSAMQTCVADSNGTVATGSQSTTFTLNNSGTTNGWVARAFSIAPFTSVSVTVNATVQAATFSIPSYTVTATRFVTVSPNVVSATFSTQSATELIDELYTPPQPFTATFSIPTYTVIAGDVTISPSAQACTFSIPSYTITAQRHVTVSPTEVSATFSVPTYTTPISVSITPSAQSATFSIPTYSIDIVNDITVSPSAQSCTFSIPSYSIAAQRVVTIAARVQSLTFGIPTYSIETIANPTIYPSTQSLLLTIPHFTITADYWQDTYNTPNTSWSDKY